MPTMEEVRCALEAVPAARSSCSPVTLATETCRVRRGEPGDSGTDLKLDHQKPKHSRYSYHGES